jgi:hypothetical protein
LKKPAGSVRFRFYKQKTEPNRNRQKTGKKTEPKPSQTEKTEKTEPNRKNRAKTGKNRAKTEKTKPNRFEPVFALKNRTEPNRTETGRFDPVSVFFKKNSVWLLFLIKTKPNRKSSPLICTTSAFLINNATDEVKVWVSYEVHVFYSRVYKTQFKISFKIFKNNNGIKV